MCSVASAPVNAQEGRKLSWTDVRKNQSQGRKSLGVTSTTLAHAVKAAAQPHLGALAEEAEFRVARSPSKRSFHCRFHKDKNPSVYLYENGLHLFCCNQTYDAIDLASIIIGGSAGQAIRWLATRYSITQQRGSRPRSQFSEADYISAELFRIGFCWALENKLAELKRPLRETGLIHGEQILRLTQLVAAARAWGPRKAVIFFTKLRRRDPEGVNRWAQQAHDLQLLLATIIAHIDHSYTNYPEDGIAA
jgi:hypothetical protein